MPEITGSQFHEKGTVDSLSQKSEGELLLDEFVRNVKELTQRIDAETGKDDSVDNQPTDRMKKFGKIYSWMMSQDARNAEAMGANALLIGPAFKPNLPLPNLIDELRGVPVSAHKPGNEWLQNDLAVTMFSIMWDYVAILAKIKIDETEIENKLAAMQWKTTITLAEAGFDKAKLQAKDLELQALKSYIQAGIAAGMLVVQVAVQTVNKAYSTVKGGINAIRSNLGTAKQAVAGAVNTVKGARNAYNKNQQGKADGAGEEGGDDIGGDNDGPSGAGTAGNNAAAPTATGPTAGQAVNNNQGPGGATPSKTGVTEGEGADVKEVSNATAAKKGAVTSFKKSVSDKFNKTMKEYENAENQKVQGSRYQAIDQQKFTGMENMFSNVASGIIDKKRAENQRNIGRVEYNQTLLQTMKDNLQKARESARKEKELAAEQIGTIFQMAAKFIDLLSQAFRMSR